jgi:hypothetical protein
VVVHGYQHISWIIHMLSKKQDMSISQSLNFVNAFYPHGTRIVRLYIPSCIDLDCSISCAVEVANCCSALTCFVKAGNSFCRHQIRLQSHDSYARTLLGISWHAALYCTPRNTVMIAVLPWLHSGCFKGSGWQAWCCDVPHSCSAHGEPSVAAPAWGKRVTFKMIIGQ